MTLEHTAFPVMTRSLMIMWVGGGSEEYDEEDKHNLEPVPSVSKVHAGYRTVK